MLKEATPLVFAVKQPLPCGVEATVSFYTSCSTQAYLHLFFFFVRSRLIAHIWGISKKMRFFVRKKKMSLSVVPKVTKWFKLCVCFADNLNAAKAEPTRPCEPVAAAQLELQPVASNAIAAKPKPMMKDLTVKLKPLPAQSPSHYKILPGKQPSSAAMSRYGIKGWFPLAIESEL